MTYYDELGVASDASPEEIHKAFRGVTRMLHPDLQPEGTMRQLAEAQMRRLNEVMETLSNENRRSVYDHSIQAVGGVAEPLVAPPNATAKYTSIPALVAGLVFGCLSMYLVSVWTRPDFEAAQRPVVEEGPVMMASPTPIARATSGRGLSRTSAAPDRAEARSVAVPTIAPPTPDLSIGLPVERDASAIQYLKPVEALATAAPLAAGPKDVLPAIAGIWLHAVDPKDKPAQWTYAAEYVELRVQERDGEIIGAYRSRYKAPNQSAHPEVAFRFRGPARSTEFEWQTGNGARGKIQLQIQSSNVMEASWTVSDSGNVNGLGAGSATLVRRLD